MNTFHFSKGHWEWDEVGKRLIYVSHDLTTPELGGAGKRMATQSSTSCAIGAFDITFREDFNTTDKLRFRKCFQRRCKLNEAELIILQDVKDVALFTANPRQLTTEFIEFFHIPMVDRFLRASIVYFQFFFQVWEKMMDRREEKKHKLMQPKVIECENILRDDLADLRSMVSREYCSLLFGAKDSRRYHHMSNKNNVSLSDRDRRFYELLIKMSTRVIWIALNRPNQFIIDMEMDRLTRTNNFSHFLNRHVKTDTLETQECEDRILKGVTNIDQRRLINQSPFGKEILMTDHDHRMLAIGQVDFPPSDDRLRFLEAVYLAPEEDISKLGFCIGILGMPRANFDIMLKPKRRKISEEEEDEGLRFEFNIPSRVYHSDETIPPSFPHIPPRFSQQSRKVIKQQCRLWKNRVEKAFLYEDTLTMDMTLYSNSQSVLFM